MKGIVKFFQLVRYPNLVFIVLTQVLFYYCIIIPAYAKHNEAGPALGLTGFLLLVVASVCIAGAGYIINDYFDLNIDSVNKPGRLVIDRFISRRWAMLFHLLLSLTGLFLTALVSMQLGNPFLLIMNFFCIILLIFYSTTFKKKLLTGNVIISLLTAWVIIVLFVAEIKWVSGRMLPVRHAALITIYKMTAVYAGFAFMISLIREVVKDMEDIEGDRKFNCRTMPIVWGLIPSKVFAGVWIIVVMGLLSVLLVNAILYKFFLLFFFIAWPMLSELFIVLRRLIRAATPQDFGEVSTKIKWVMLLGILSMILYYYYLG